MSWRVTIPKSGFGKAYMLLQKASLVNTPGETSRLYVQMTSTSHAPGQLKLTNKSTLLDKPGGIE